jgi:hypothetical protein
MKIMTVSDLIKFLNTIPHDTKISVLKEMVLPWRVETVFSHVENESSFSLVDGIDYFSDNKTIYFGKRG